MQRVFVMLASLAAAAVVHAGSLPSENFDELAPQFWAPSEAAMSAIGETNAAPDGGAALDALEDVLRSQWFATDPMRDFILSFDRIATQGWSEEALAAAFGSIPADTGAVTAAVPEPGALVLVGAALAALGLTRRRRAA